MPQVPEPFIKIKYFHEYFNQNIYKNNIIINVKIDNIKNNQSK